MTPKIQIAFALLLVAGVSAQSVVDVPPASFFPAKESDILGWVSANNGNGNIKELRKHAWQLLDLVTQPVTKPGPPPWSTWYQWGDDLGREQTPKPTVTFRVFAPLISLKFHLDVGTSGAPVDDQKDQHWAETAAVLYNSAAYNFIVGKCLNLTQLEKLGSCSARSLPEFPRGSIIVKAYFAKVTPATCAVKGMDEQLNLQRRPESSASLKSTPSDPVYVAAEGRSNRCKEMYPSSVVLELGDFFTAEALGAPNDKLLLVAMHIITREIPNWFWATYWWSDKSDSKFANDRLHASHFLMDVAYSMDQPLDSDGKARIVYNPYIEGPFPELLKSNCMSCHVRAALRSSVDITKPATRGCAEALQADANPPWASRLKTSFLWTLTLHEHPQSKSLPWPPSCPSTCPPEQFKFVCPK